MIKFAVCDDEQSMIQSLTEQIQNYMDEKGLPSYSVSCFSKGRLLLESNCDFDVIFLDIQMEPPNGMESAKILRGRKNPALLIFVTVLQEYVFDAFEVEAYAYLVKPLDGGQFKKTMDRAVKALSERRAGIVIQRGASCEAVRLSEIVYCEIQGRKIYIHRSNGEVTGYYDKLEALEQRVDGRFFKCHRSYLVNLAFVRGSGEGQVILSQGERIPLSRLRERNFTQALLRYMKERSC